MCLSLILGMWRSPVIQTKRGLYPQRWYWSDNLWTTSMFKMLFKSTKICDSPSLFHWKTWALVSDSKNNYCVLRRGYHVKYRFLKCTIKRGWINLLIWGIYFKRAFYLHSGRSRETWKQRKNNADGRFSYLYYIPSITCTIDGKKSLKLRLLEMSRCYFWCHTFKWLGYFYQDLSVEELESKCYDKFDFKMEDLQILIAKAGNGDWVCTKFCVIDSVSRPVKTAIARMLIAYMPDRQG